MSISGSKILLYFGVDIHRYTLVLQYYLRVAFIGGQRLLLL